MISLEWFRENRIKANPDKSCFIVTTNALPSVNINDFYLSEVSVRRQVKNYMH